MSDDHNSNIVSQTPYQPNSAKVGCSIGDKPARDSAIIVPQPWGATHAHPAPHELPSPRMTAEHPTVRVGDVGKPQARSNPVDNQDEAGVPIRPQDSFRFSQTDAQAKPC